MNKPTEAFLNARMAEKKDFPAILALRRECLQYLLSYKNVIEKQDFSVNSILCVVEETGSVVGSGRLDLQADSDYKLTRVVTDASKPTKGVGTLVVRHLEQSASPGKSISLRCLIKNKLFYEKLGYHVYGPSYQENGLKYVNMKKISTP